MSGQTQLIISMIITAGVAGALVYCVVLTRESVRRSSTRCRDDLRDTSKH